jgi:hypothetical protein
MQADHDLSTSVGAAVTGEVISPGVIGVNFAAGRWPLRAAAGRAFWNNADGAAGTDLPLRDSTGAVTAARLSFEAASAYAEFAAPGTLNRAVNRLYRGGLVGNDTVREVTVRLTGVPYPRYDVFVFASADTTDRSTLSLTDGRTTFYYRSAGGTNARTPRLLRTRSEDATEPTPGPAQYQVFAGRTGPAVTLTTGGSRDCVLSNNVFGLQIVQTVLGQEPGERSADVERLPRRTRNGGPTYQPPRSELFVPFAPGSVVRVRYRGGGADARLGGGALNIYSGEDIALHVNPRPKLGVLVLNSHVRGGWGPEERPDGYPVDEPGEVYLEVRAGPDGFVIRARLPDEGTAFNYRYAYRLPPSRRLDRITIDLPDLLAAAVQPEE